MNSTLHPTTAPSPPPPGHPGLVVIIGDHQSVPLAGLREMLLDLGDGKHLLLSYPPEPKPST